MRSALLPERLSVAQLAPGSPGWRVVAAGGFGREQEFAEEPAQRVDLVGIQDAGVKAVPGVIAQAAREIPPARCEWADGDGQSERR